MFSNALKILYLGPKGTYTEIAMRKFVEYFNISVQFDHISTIKKVIQEAEKNNNFYAVVPIENSNEGIVRETIDSLLFTNEKFQILAQTYVPISHCLIAKGTKDKINTIVSHPQAISQCQIYISKNFGKNVNIIPESSTSHATKFILDKPDNYASIGNELCAKMYNLNIIDKNINDIKDNKTRFVLLGNTKEKLEQNRTSIVFSTKNKPGALLEVLEVFKKYNLNLIYLESRPSKEKFGDYNFYADIDKSLIEINNAIIEIKNLCDFCKILGSYATI